MQELDGLRGATILVTGADGMLGRGFTDVLHGLGNDVEVHALDHEQLDVTDADAVAACERHQPDLILHCAGLALADRCEREPELARHVHVGGARNVARLARRCGSMVFYPQSVFIFDGRELPVTESTRPAPGLVYGRVKLEAEETLLAEAPQVLSVRMAGFFGGDAKDKNFVGTFIRGLGSVLAGGGAIAVGDRVWQPTYTLDLARNTLVLLARGCSGVYHMGALGEATFFDVARACVEALGLEGDVHVSRSSAAPFDAAEAARRPSRMVTANRRLEAEGLCRQRPWDEALREYLRRPYFDPMRRDGIT